MIKNKLIKVNFKKNVFFIIFFLKFTYSISTIIYCSDFSPSSSSDNDTIIPFEPAVIELNATERQTLQRILKSGQHTHIEFDLVPNAKKLLLLIINNESFPTHHNLLSLIGEYQQSPKLRPKTIAIIQCLLQWGCDFNESKHCNFKDSENERHFSPFVWAIMYRQVETIRIFLKSQTINPNQIFYRTPSEPLTPLDIALDILPNSDLLPPPPIFNVYTPQNIRTIESLLYYGASDTIQNTDQADVIKLVQEHLERKKWISKLAALARRKGKNLPVNVQAIIYEFLNYTTVEALRSTMPKKATKPTKRDRDD